VPLLVAAIISAGVAWLSWQARTLTPSGTVAAWTIGTLVLYGTGWAGGAVLAAFFIAGNLVSRVGRAPPSLFDPKSDRRDAWQVYANGGAAAVGALAGRADPALGVWLVTASLAAAAADTWATSVGTRSASTPRLLGFGRQVPAGTNGGMSMAGSAAAAAAAMIVSGVGAAAAGMSILLPAGTLIGFAGMMADSLAGTALQGRFHCPRCDHPSEWKIHRCGSATVRRGGLPWVNNDAVNFLATSLAALAALILWPSLE
jgi:uncharacterized protein (TIGR00297 family)